MIPGRVKLDWMDLEVQQKRVQSFCSKSALISSFLVFTCFIALSLDVLLLHVNYPPFPNYIQTKNMKGYLTPICTLILIILHPSPARAQLSTDCVRPATYNQECLHLLLQLINFIFGSEFAEIFLAGLRGETPGEFCWRGIWSVGGRWAASFDKTNC